MDKQTATELTRQRMRQTGRSNSNVTRRQEKKQKSDAATQAKLGRLEICSRRQKGRCWFCNEPMGYDCTREHLLARARGGTDDPKNIRAAHGDCNSAAGHLPVKRKYELRRIGHAAGRAAVLEAAHRMRRHETYLAFVTRPEPPQRELKAFTATLEEHIIFKAVSKAEKMMRKRQARMEAEAAALRNQEKREKQEKYWKKLGLPGKPEWWDG